MTTLGTLPARPTYSGVETRPKKGVRPGDLPSWVSIVLVLVASLPGCTPVNRDRASSDSEHAAPWASATSTLTHEAKHSDVGLAASVVSRSHPQMAWAPIPIVSMALRPCDVPYDEPPRPPLVPLHDRDLLAGCTTPSACLQFLLDPLANQGVIFAHDGRPRQHGRPVEIMNLVSAKTSAKVRKTLARLPASPEITHAMITLDQRGITSSLTHDWWAKHDEDALDLILASGHPRRASAALHRGFDASDPGMIARLEDAISSLPREEGRRSLAYLRHRAARAASVGKKGLSWPSVRITSTKSAVPIWNRRDTHPLVALFIAALDDSDPRPVAPHEPVSRLAPPSRPHRLPFPEALHPRCDERRRVMAGRAAGLDLVVRDVPVPFDEIHATAVTDDGWLVAGTPMLEQFHGVVYVRAERPVPGARREARQRLPVLHPPVWVLDAKVYALFPLGHGFVALAWDELDPTATAVVWLHQAGTWQHERLHTFSGTADAFAWGPSGELHLRADGRRHTVSAPSRPGAEDKTR